MDTYEVALERSALVGQAMLYGFPQEVDGSREHEGVPQSPGPQ